MSSNNFEALSIRGKRWVRWLPLHNIHGNLNLLFFFSTVSWLVDRMSSTCYSEADDMGWRGCVDQSSITLDRLGKSLRIWIPLQSLQGYLGLWVVWVILTSSTLPTWLTITSFFPTCLTMVRGFDPCLSFFFLFFCFFFFLSTKLISWDLSLGEEDEIEEDLASEEGKEDRTGEDGEGSTWGWCSWGGSAYDRSTYYIQDYLSRKQPY